MTSVVIFTAGRGLVSHFQLLSKRIRPPARTEDTINLDLIVIRIAFVFASYTSRLDAVVLTLLRFGHRGDREFDLPGLTKSLR